MSASVLKQLTVQHLRGSVVPFSLPFEKGKKLIVIYGENGSGKSTICDAFEFLGKGRVGSLENRGLGKTGRYWHSLGKKPSDVSVTLDMTTAACTATIGKGEVVLSNPKARPRVEVLRRAQILSLIEATPADRYAAISRFIDVSTIEAAETVLRKLIDDSKNSVNVASARVQENEDALRQFWATAGKPVADPFAWAKVEATRDPTVLDTEAAAIVALQRAYAALIELPSAITAAQATLGKAQETATAAKNSETECLKTIAIDAGELVALLQSAKQYLSKHPSPTVCPLCESAEKAASLSSRINERLTSFASLQTAQAKTNSSQLAVKQAEQHVQSQMQQLVRQVTAFEDCRKKYTWPTDVTMPTSAAPTDLAALSAWLTATTALPAEWKKAEVSRHDKKQFVNTLRQALQTWRDNIETQKNLNCLIPSLTKILTCMEEERHLFTSAILASIATEVGRLYEIVHPGEGQSKISLDLDPGKRASLEIGASFCGQNTPPQAYFSDSHLDTLGLCVFIALSSMDQPSDTILVLDDILASVDEPHVERLIEMIYAEVMRFQHCVITTHYRPWKQKLRWGWLKNGECQFVELAKWTSTSGMTLIRSIPDVDRLKKLLAESPPDPQLVCAKAGVILEAALDFLTLQYECAVPRRQIGAYTLGDLLPSIDKKLRQAMKVEVLKGKDSAGQPVYETVSLTSVLDELLRIAQVRNVFGCHFNEISFDFLDSDAIGFGNQVSALMSILTDDVAGWPKNGKSGSYWATTGETRRLHPYKKPA